MGFIAYDTYHCRFRYGKYILCRRGGGGFDLPGFKRGESKDYRHGVTMAASGIRKGALERLGLEVKCYLADPRVAEMASRMNITRTQAGIRLATEEHPDALYVFR